MIVRCWDERFECSPPTSQAAEAWSATRIDNTALCLQTGSSSTSICIRLPAAAAAVPSSDPDELHRAIDAVFKVDHFELRLGTKEGQSSTRARTDLDIQVPYPAATFRKHRPDSLVCAAENCSGRAVLADLRNVDRYNDLPSEHWAELLDAWMCHHDQTLSDELIHKGNNIWPKAGQGLLSTSAMLLNRKNATGWRRVVHSEVRAVFLQRHTPSCLFSGLIRRPALAFGGLMVLSSSDTRALSKRLASLLPSQADRPLSTITRELCRYPSS